MSMSPQNRDLIDNVFGTALLVSGTNQFTVEEVNLLMTLARAQGRRDAVREYRRKLLDALADEVFHGEL